MKTIETISVKMDFGSGFIIIIHTETHIRIHKHTLITFKPFQILVNVNY